MKNYFKILFISLLAIFVFAQNSNAKDFSGIIIYKVSVGDDVDPQVAAMMPKTVKVYIKDNKMKTVMATGMGTTTVIYDANTENSFTLMDIMGQKMAVKMTTEELKEKQGEVPDVEVTVTGETKEIAGYTCKKAIVKEKGDNAVEHIVYFTDELGSGALNGLETIYKDIDGVMLEYASEQNDIKLSFKAINVEKKKLSDKEFEVPADYKVLSADEIQSMFGG